MKRGTKYNILTVDGKGRVHLPKDVREEMDIQNQILLEKEKNLLILKPVKKIDDPLKFLASINVKTKKSPVEMKREDECAFGE